VVLDAEFGSPNILLVEEPEVHLHPGLERSLMQYLLESTRRRQVFITTHSTNFIDTAATKHIYLVRKDTSTQIEPIKIETEFDLIADQLGLRLSSLFMFDRLVFVEGPSDEAILREWAAKLEISFSRRNVGFVQLKGIGNFTHFAAKETLSFLAKRRVRMWFLVDRDERTEVELKATSARLGADAQFFATKGRELENYLLLPRPNLRYLTDRVLEEGIRDISELTEEDYIHQLDEKAEQLKKLSEYKRILAVACKPLYPPRRSSEDLASMSAVDEVKSNLCKMIEQATESVQLLDARAQAISADFELRWSKEKLLLVPGSELLDAWYSGFGLRFDKMRDSQRIAALMETAEIPREIANLLQAIGG